MAGDFLFTDSTVSASFPSSDESVATEVEDTVPGVLVRRVALRMTVFRLVAMGSEETALVLTRALRLTALGRVLAAVAAFAEDRPRGAFRFAPELAFFRFATTRFMTDYWLRLGFLLRSCNANSGVVDGFLCAGFSEQLRIKRPGI